MLLHCFQQCTLHLGWSTVDFVGKDEVREDWPLLHGEIFLLLTVHQCPDDVSGQEVRRELDALIVCADELRERLDGQGLCQTWESFEQDMPS